MIPQEIQSAGGEVAKASGAVRAGDSGSPRGSEGASCHLGREAGSLEAVAEGSHRSVDVMSPVKQSSTDSVAAPSPSPATPEEKVEGGSTTGHGEAVRGDVGGGSCAPAAGQLPGTRPDSQPSGNSKNLTSTGARASASSGPSPGMGAPKSKSATACAGHQSQDPKTPPRSSQAGKDKAESRQKVSPPAPRVRV